MPEPYQTFYLGIDPGKSGGIVVLHEDGHIHQLVPLSGLSCRGVYDALKSPVCHSYATCYVWMERVNGYMGNGGGDVGSRPNSRSGELMRNYGWLEMALEVLDLTKSTTFIMPTSWQAKLGLKRAKGEGKTKWKGRLKETAKGVFAGMDDPLAKRITNATADAALLARMCWSNSRKSSAVDSSRRTTADGDD